MLCMLLQQMLFGQPLLYTRKNPKPRGEGEESEGGADEYDGKVLQKVRSLPGPFPLVKHRC